VVDHLKRTFELVTGEQGGKDLPDVASIPEGDATVGGRQEKKPSMHASTGTESNRECDSSGGSVPGAGVHGSLFRQEETRPT